MIVVSECLECTLEVSLQDARADDFLTLLTLWTSLRVVFTHVLIVSCAESDDTLLAFVADIDSNKHCLSRYLLSEIESPKISAQLGVDLSQNVDIDSIIVFLDGFT